MIIKQFPISLDLRGIKDACTIKRDRDLKCR